MIKSITAINYLGEEIKMDLAEPEQSGFVVKSVEGIGPGKANVNTTEIASMDGALFNSARVPSRNIVLSLEFLFQDTIEETRHRTYKYFPLKKWVKLIFETDERTCEIEGRVESNEPDIFSKNEGASISIVCPSPYFYAVGEDGVHRSVFRNTIPGFEFPFSNESLTNKLIEFGSLITGEDQRVGYYGDAEIGVTIRIHATGEASDITIYNLITREIMRIDTDKLERMTGKALVAGDEITICTVKGSKSVTLFRDGEFYNMLGCLSLDADWFQLSVGDNVFAFEAEHGISNLEFTIENRVVYEGV